VIHFTNGDSVGGTLREAVPAGEIVICADPLHEGPCEAGLSPEAFDEARAGYLAGQDYATLADIEAAFDVRARAIERAAVEDEAVLWFEHDLFDQLNLLWLLDRLQRGHVPMDRVRLIVIGEFRGVDPFHGLGQLTAPQLASLFPARVPLTGSQVSYAAEAWAAVCAPAPGRMASLAADTSAPLRFVPAAIRRLLEELPGRLDGLSRTERQGLGAFATGATTLPEAFGMQAQLEAAVFLGDLSFFRAMRALGHGDAPLLRFEGNAVVLTGDGVSVLAGDADQAALNGLDRWVGGIRLTGRTPRVRWNPERGVVVTA
jgi:Domain of unknown function (DUF1835)